MKINLYPYQKKCEMLIKMEQYVKSFEDVSDEMFYEMLQDTHLKTYQNLINNYQPTDGGIASDLRKDGWYSIAQYIAFTRNTSKNNCF